MASFDVIAVMVKAPHTVRLLDGGKTELNAEAIVNMAVARRGVDIEFYAVVPSGAYRDGDKWSGPGDGQ